MRLITFVGAGKYEETTYLWRDPQGREHAHTSPYAPVASAQALGVEQIAILVTEEARAKHGAALAQALQGVAAVEWAPIPSGANEDEMWAIYAALGGCVAADEEIALDVTHGFRSLPLVVLLATAFLRVARGVQVRHILYGAYDARDQSVQPSRTPVFDLAPMFALLDWANAADRFAGQGDARDLAALLRREIPPYQAQQADGQARKRAIRLGELAKSLDEVSANLLLSRPHRAMEAAAKLRPRLEAAGNLLPATQPFDELRDKISAAFSWLALPQPTKPQNLWANLALQRRLIRWYVERGHYLQACTLEREWLVSWRLLHRGGLNLLDKEAREKAEHDLGTLHGAAKEGRLRVQSEGAPRGVDLGDLWGKATLARNELAHVVDYPERGRGASAAPKALLQQIEWCLAQIERLEIPEIDEPSSHDREPS